MCVCMHVHVHVRVRERVVWRKKYYVNFIAKRVSASERYRAPLRCPNIRMHVRE